MHGAGNDFVVIDDRSKTFAVEDMRYSAIVIVRQGLVRMD